VIGWADDHRELATPEFIELAQVAVVRVEAPSSELRALWFEGEEDDAGLGNEWAAAVSDLRGRLTTG
jgi:hypothetical protein